MKRVVILKDSGSPLHFIRCAEPCEHQNDGQWCQRHPVTGERLCWLGSGLTPERAAKLARRVGYEVVP